MARYELSIEVIHAAFPASSWKNTYGDMLTTTAMEHGADDWQWVERPWGVVFEVAFKTELDADFWLDLPAVRAAFDAVPDPIAGLVFHRGWGGTSGRDQKRKRGPRAGAGGAEVPLPEDPELTRRWPATPAKTLETSGSAPQPRPRSCGALNSSVCS